MVRRHAILYDVERWRRNRTWLLLPATSLLLATILTAILRPRSGSTATFQLVGAGLYAFAVSLWVRQRFSYLSVNGDTLVVRAMSMRRRVPLHDVRNVRVARLGAVFNRPERRRLLPRRGTGWLDTQAIIVRLDSEVDELMGLRRLLGPRCVIERDLVVPVVDPDGLLAEINEGRPAEARLPAQRSGRRRR